MCFTGLKCPCFLQVHEAEAPSDLVQGREVYIYINPQYDLFETNFFPILVENRGGFHGRLLWNQQQTVCWVFNRSAALFVVCRCLRLCRLFTGVVSMWDTSQNCCVMFWRTARNEIGTISLSIYLSTYLSIYLSHTLYLISLTLMVQ